MDNISRSDFLTILKSMPKIWLAGKTEQILESSGDSFFSKEDLEIISPDRITTEYQDSEAKLQTFEIPQDISDLGFQSLKESTGMDASDFRGSEISWLKENKNEMLSITFPGGEIYVLYKPENSSLTVEHLGNKNSYPEFNCKLLKGGLVQVKKRFHGSDQKNISVYKNTDSAKFVEMYSSNKNGENENHQHSVNEVNQTINQSCYFVTSDLRFAKYTRTGDTAKLEHFTEKTNTITVLEDIDFQSIDPKNPLILSHSDGLGYIQNPNSFTRGDIPQKEKFVFIQDSGVRVKIHLSAQPDKIHAILRDPRYEYQPDTNLNGQGANPNQVAQITLHDKIENKIYPWMAIYKNENGEYNVVENPKTADSINSYQIIDIAPEQHAVHT